MHLVVTAVACIITLIFMLIDGKKRMQSLLRLFLIYFSASLMWLVDVIAVTLEGEKFFIFNQSDLILGFVVVFLGLATHVALSLYERKKKINMV